MSEVDRIQNQLERAFAGGAWHGPSVQDLLKGVTATQAAAHPIVGAHSIWELVLHIAAWESAGRRRLAGDRAQLPDEEDWPAVTETSEVAWQEALAALKRGHEEFTRAIAGVQESRLDQPIIEDMSTVYVTLHGIIQHDLYHAGQIAILKRALTEVAKQ